MTMLRNPRVETAVFLSFALTFVCALAISAFAQTAPANASALRARGVELYRQKKYSEAAEVLKQAITKDKADADSWYFYGLALIANQALKDASKAFETTVKLRPNFAGAHSGLAYALMLRNKTDGAAREAQAALALDSNIADAYYVLGVCRLRAGAREEALQNAEAAIKLEPESAPAYLLKSQALVSFLGDVIVGQEENSAKARYREAADALTKYLELNPNSEYKATWAEQLETLRSFVNGRKPGEEALVFSSKEVTTKVRVLSKPEPQYTNEARALGVTGTVVLRCIFAADGAVKHFLVVRGLPGGLTQRAIGVARGIKFVPATKDGRPVSTFMQLEYNFSLY
jgi:tetratricopeptide (TPR) repeat protein